MSMPHEDKITKVCEKCGEPKFVDRGGREVQLRCRCDWVRGFTYRLRTTVPPDFWAMKSGPKRMSDWSPKMFRPPNFMDFRDFARAQKSIAVKTIYDFAFRTDRDGNVSMLMAAEMGRNMAIRGPRRSGRGLLMACMKMLCATKDISTNPVPDEWSQMKYKLMGSEGLGGPLVEEAKLDVQSMYLDPKILFVEDIRGNREKGFNGTETSRKIRGSTAMDNLLSERESQRKGCVLSSEEFSHQIGMSLGDKMLETLSDPRTERIILLSEPEAMDLLKSLNDRYKEFRKRVKNVASGVGDKRAKTVSDEHEEARSNVSVVEALHFSEAFRSFPNLANSSVTIDAYKIEQDLGSMIDMSPEDFPEEVVEVYQDFVEEKGRRGASFLSAQVQAKRSVVKKTDWGKMLSDAEADKVADILSAACRGSEYVDEMVREAKKLRAEMSGEEGPDG